MDNWYRAQVTDWDGDWMHVVYEIEAGCRAPKEDMVHATVLELTPIKGKTRRECSGWIWNSHKEHLYRDEHGAGGYEHMELSSSEEDDAKSDSSENEVDMQTCGTKHPRDMEETEVPCTRHGRPRRRGARYLPD